MCLKYRKSKTSEILEISRNKCTLKIGCVSGVSGNDFWGFGNGNGNRKFHSQSLGTGRELKIPFPKFGNGKGMKKSIPKIREREGNEKIHSQSSGKGIRGLHSWEWPGTGTGIIFYPLFWIFFLPGSTLKFFSLTLCPKIFSWLPHMYSDSQKNWDKNSM